MWFGAVSWVFLRLTGVVKWWVEGEVVGSRRGGKGGVWRWLGGG